MPDPNAPGPLAWGGPVLHEDDGQTSPLPLPASVRQLASSGPEFRGPEVTPGAASDAILPDLEAANTDSENTDSENTDSANNRPVKNKAVKNKPVENKPVEQPVEQDRSGVASPERSGDVDPRMVQETQQQIKALVDEMVALARREVPPAEFYYGFATRCVTALSAIGAAIWLRDGQQLQLEQQVNLAQTGLPSQGEGALLHDQLLKRVFRDAEPMVVLPGTSNSSEASGNPTSLLLLLVPIVEEGQPQGLIEIFQRPGAGPVTQRGYLRFLSQMSDIAAGYHRQRRWRDLEAKQQLWGQFDQFLRCVHESLDVSRTTMHVVNEGRRLIDCDRVSVALARGAQLRISATSGLDRVHRRADQIRLMEQLVTAVCRAKQPLYYAGPTDDLPPQIEQALQAYLDVSHSQALAIVPLVHAPKAVDDQVELTKARQAIHVKKKLIAALIVEQMSERQLTEDKRHRIGLVTEHGAAALANALDHHSVFLLPVWRFLGRGASLFAPGALPKTAAVAVVTALVLAVMMLFPYDFTMSAKGVIQPAVRHEVYSQVEGVVSKIPLPNQQNVLVTAGQRLVEMTNRDMESEYTTLVGKMQETSELYQQKVQSEKLLTERLEKMQLQAEIQQLESDFRTMEARAEILREKLRSLMIDAPIDGQIVHWNLRQTLMGRPLLAGERLMTVVDLQGPWELELYLPERGASHVLQQARDSAESIQVEFQLASHPGETYLGRVTHIDQRAEVHERHGNCLKVLVAFEDQQVPESLRRTGTGVTAKLHCGRRPLGYVWFREVWETLQSQVLFWI